MAKVLLILLMFSLVFFFSNSGSAQNPNHDYFLVPVDLQIYPGDSTIEVNIYLHTGRRIKSFFVPLFVEGTSNPVLDTVLTGGLQDTNPPGFAPPSIVTGMHTKIVNPYGPPTDPMYFLAKDSVYCVVPGTFYLYCKMFYKVSGPGTLTFRTAVHSTLGAVHMIRETGDSLPLSWPAEGEIGSYNVVPYTNKYSLDPVDLWIGVGDSTIQVNINIKTRDTIQSFLVPLYAEGTSNPVLDTVLTGGLGDPNPPGFASPSLVTGFSDKVINPYGPPSDPLVLMAKDSANPLPPDTGLFCKMFYKITGTGTLTFRTAPHSTFGNVSMRRPDNTPAPVNWPVDSEVASFTVVGGFIWDDEYILDPVDLVMSPYDSIVQVNININTNADVQAFVVPLEVTGTSNPVLNTMLTGKLSDANPPCFNSPSLVKSFTQRIVNENGIGGPGGPWTEPLLFIAVSFGGGPLTGPANGLYCATYWDVTGPGTLNFTTNVHSTGGPVRMVDPENSRLPISWGTNELVGSFEVTQTSTPGDVNWNGVINISDVIYIIAYLYKGGPAPVPEISVADVNCDTKITVSDVIYLINYLFKGGPPPCE